MTSSWRTFWIVTLTALLFRALLLVATGPEARYAMTSDSYSYTDPAVTLKLTGHFAKEVSGTIIPELYRTPGYPLFLIPFLTPANQLRHRAVQWTQTLLGACTVGLLSLCAMRFWGESKAALLTGALFAFDFVHAIHSLFVLTDVLFVFVLTLALYACLRNRLAWCGLLLALAALVRPIGVYYPAFLGLLLVGSLVQDRSAKRLGAVMLFFLSSLLPMGAWVARNHAYSGRWSFSSLQDANLYLVRAAVLESQTRNIPYEQAVQELEKKASASTDEGRRDLWAMDYLRAHKMDYAQFMAKDFIKLLSGNSMKIAAWALLKDERYAPNAAPGHTLESPLSQLKSLWIAHRGLGIGMLAYFLFLGAVYLLCLRGLYRSIRTKGWGVTLVMFSSALYFVAVTLGADAQARYRLPLLPALFLFAGGGYRIAASKETR